MRYQELRQPLAGITPWRLTVVFAIFTLACVFAIQFFHEPQGEAKSALEFAEIAGLAVLFVDIAVNFIRAESKSRFVREKWFELLLFVPFFAVFEAFRVYEIFEVMGIRALPLLMRTRILVNGGHALSQLASSEPVELAKMAVVGAVMVPDRYRTMKYRGLLSFN